MPELPEVETIRRDLHDVLSGRMLGPVEVSGTRSVRRHGDSGEVPARSDGRRVLGVERQGKFLLIRLQGPDVLVVHLGMSGQLLLGAPGAARPPHTHVTFGVSGGAELRFVDPRTFGQIFVTTAGSGGDVPELAHLGFDALRPGRGGTRLAAALAGRRAPVKAVLMDQRRVAGIGNLYADEILFGAGVRPDRPAGSLAPNEVRRTARAMVETLRQAITCRGSSLADQQYRDVYGAVGGYQQHHRVYGRQGQPCTRCRTPVVRSRGGGRSTFFCPTCQR